MLPVSSCIASRQYTGYFIAVNLGGISRDTVFVKYPVNISGKDDELIPSSFIFSGWSIFLYSVVSWGLCRCLPPGAYPIKPGDSKMGCETHRAWEGRAYRVGIAPQGRLPLPPCPQLAPSPPCLPERVVAGAVWPTVWAGVVGHERMWAHFAVWHYH